VLRKLLVMKLLTRGQTLITVYEAGRSLNLDHEDSLALAMQAIEHLWDDNTEVLYSVTYLTFRKSHNPKSTKTQVARYLGEMDNLRKRLEGRG
jgi:hypothetical protein